MYQLNTEPPLEPPPDLDAEPEEHGWWNPWAVYDQEEDV